jgi:chloramphenicol O-acetyltransferase type B
MSHVGEVLTSHIPALSYADSRVSVGEFTYGNPRFFLWHDAERIEIGKYCSIAEETAIMGGGEHRSDWVTTHPLRIAFADPLAYQDGHPATKGPTRIGNDVWLGYRSVVLSGVSIGDGAIIGAGSIVTRDVPPYAIVAGNPATEVRRRFTQQQIDDLLTIKWWNWPAQEVRNHISVLCSSDIDTFIKLAKEISF